MFDPSLFAPELPDPADPVGDLAVAAVWILKPLERRPPLSRIVGPGDKGAFPGNFPQNGDITDNRGNTRSHGLQRGIAVSLSSGRLSQAKGTAQDSG